MKKVSVIIPCYNGEKHLKKCWESLKMQTIGLKDLECIFVDDCSVDHTWNILEEIRAEAPDTVRLVHSDENLRQGGARNIGLTYASGEYVQFLDQDDRLLPFACAELYQYAKKYRTDLIQFNYADEDGDPVEGRFCDKDGLYVAETVLDRKRLLASDILYCAHHNLFYKRTLILKADTRFPEKRLFEEPLFVYPLFFYATTFLVLHKGYYRMLRHPEGTTETILGEHLGDHPVVQRMLYNFLRERGFTDIYREEIESYFVWTYYVETVLNAKNGGRLSLEELRKMQKTVRTIYPHFMENPYLKGLEDRFICVLETVNKSYESMKELCTELDRSIKA